MIELTINIESKEYKGEASNKIQNTVSRICDCLRCVTWDFQVRPFYIHGKSLLWIMNDEIGKSQLNAVKEFLRSCLLPGSASAEVMVERFISLMVSPEVERFFPESAGNISCKPVMITLNTPTGSVVTISAERSSKDKYNYKF